MAGYVHGATRGRRLGPGVVSAADLTPVAIARPAPDDNRAPLKLSTQRAYFQRWNRRNRLAAAEYERSRTEVDEIARDPYGLREYSLRRMRALSAGISYPEIALALRPHPSVVSKDTTTNKGDHQ
jgi:hypothetical protein